MGINNEETLKKAYQNYQRLKQEVNHWQQERRAYWRETIRLADTPPYLPLVDLPEEAIFELWQRLNHAAKAEISNAELQKLWEQFSSQQDTMDQDQTTRFRMAITGVAELASEMANTKTLPLQRTKDDPEKESTCPVCNEVSTLAILLPPNGQRIMHCTTCSYEWPVKRVGCLRCGCEDAKKQMFLKNPAFPAIEMAVCQLCGHFFKEIDTRASQVPDYKWEDLKSLPLNYATELWLSNNPPLGKSGEADQPIH